MEQILNKLSEIEATANAIMQDAARQKQALSEFHTQPHAHVRSCILLLSASLLQNRRYRHQIKTPGTFQ